MQEKEIKVKIIHGKSAEGDILAYPNPISFLGEVDPKRGVILGIGREELSLRGKVLIFPNTRGSTVGSYVLYALRYYGNAPSAIVVSKAEPILIVGAVLADIPLAEGVDSKSIEEASKFKKAVLDAERSVLRLFP
ncbi:MAG: aconitase X swivel domain-containing protein [Fervidicoccaceae archaeon]|jgi:predicted aconitase with swiveling domain|uniref:DUF126 domain-containing protein n=1 Tax=Fervidicoccus fontis TaxID=683846 RepID=A0A7C2YTW9_9CREN|nr:MAG: hypothetical protein C0179_03365 [Fervidicoccus sp.]HEU98178.1 DUF126 domain-containing protein [Fervidicoccus fontis]